MTQYRPFYIATFENDSGLDQYLEPFLIPEKAFPVLEDAYAFRGRIRRRQGFKFLGRLRRAVTGLAQTNTIAGATYTDSDLLNSVRATEPNAEIEPGSVTLTIDPGGGNETIYRDSVTSGILTYISGPFTISAGTINYVTGAVSLTFTVQPGAAVAVEADLSYFPELPVMGLPTRETTNINDEQLIAFDTKYAYRFQSSQFEELPAVTPTTWNGSDSDLFWTTNYYSNVNGDLFWATNFNKSGTPDPIRYYDGLDWTTFAPTINGANELHQCRILLPYKDRLVAMNTWEGATLAASVNFPQRIRFSQNGDPADLVNGWLDNVSGRGGYIDIPTNEMIISAEFIKDTLLVKCERSSWKVVYTGNEALPFVPQQINTELGAESTFSLIPFDRGVFSVGNYGITTDDSVNVARIDLKIPNIIFDFNNDKSGVKRVYGVRDYAEQLVYWTFPSADANPTYPNKVLVYNYVNSTYAIFNDSFTCYGYYQRTTDETWATLPYESWAEWDDAWDSGRIQSAYPNVVAGNQQGFVEILNQGIFNEESLAIKAITSGTPVRLTVPNHNLQTGRFIKVTGILGTGSPNPTTLNGTIYRALVIDTNTIDLQLYNSSTGQFDNVTLGAGGTYIGGGTLTVLNNINIRTKRFSPFYNEGSQVRIGYIDFFLDKTSLGEVSVNVYIDENTSIPINDPSDVNNVGVVGDNIVLTRPETGIPFQAQQDKIWHRLFVYSVCQNFQLQFYLDDAQMSDEDINSCDFIMHAMTLYLTPNARMTQ